MCIGGASSEFYWRWLECFTLRPIHAQVGEQESRGGHGALLLPQCFLLQGAIEIVSGSDQAEMGESMGKVPERCAAMADHLGVEADVIHVTQHLLEQQARFP